jgi:DNA-binding PadR family transcriptional regulator
LAHCKGKGTPLKLFSGKQRDLNRLVLRVLRASNQPLTKYDVYLLIHGVKGSRHITSKTVYRRMDALNSECYITENGSRPGKVQGESVLYQLTRKGVAALKLDRQNWDEYLRTATDDDFRKLDEALPP